MKKFDKFEEFSKSVKEGNIVELLFKKDTFFNSKRETISSESDNSTISVEKIVGYYNDASNLSIGKRKQFYLDLRSTNSMFTKILIGDYNEIVIEYRILE